MLLSSTNLKLLFLCLIAFIKQVIAVFCKRTGWSERLVRVDRQAGVQGPERRKRKLCTHQTVFKVFILQSSLQTIQLYNRYSIKGGSHTARCQLWISVSWFEHMRVPSQNTQRVSISTAASQSLLVCTLKFVCTFIYLGNKVLKR